MNFSYHSEIKASDGSLKVILKVPEPEMIQLGFILESFEGYCYYSTINRKESLMQIDIPPDFIEPVKNILRKLESY